MLESESFRRARPRGGSDRNTREDTDEKGIRFQQCQAWPGCASSTRKNSNNYSSRQRYHRAFPEVGRSRGRRKLPVHDQRRTARIYPGGTPGSGRPSCGSQRGRGGARGVSENRMKDRMSSASKTEKRLNATLGDLHNAFEFSHNAQNCDYRFRFLGALPRYPTQKTWDRFFYHLRKSRSARRHVAREHLSRRSMRRAVVFLLLLVRAED